MYSCYEDLHFANEYKIYLEEIGMISFSGRELTGLGRVERNDVVKVTTEQREYNPLIPDDMYVIENMDGIVIWQDASGKVYQTEAACSPHLIATSLVEYLSEA